MWTTMLLLTLTTFICCLWMHPINGQNVDYCDPKLCKLWNGDSYNQVKNIACNNDGQLQPNCPNSTKLATIEKYIDLILHLHNDGRNKIATGNIGHLDPAQRMSTMKWNQELQFMSELNCKKCVYAHDKCRNTPTFPNSGQNIGIVRTTGHKTFEQAIKKIFNDWYKENKNAHMHNIKNFTGSDGGPSIGHFTQVVQDTAVDIGCAIIQWHELHHGKQQEATYFVCNYACGNMAETPIYIAGSTATQCMNGTNPKYEGLCSKNEVVIFNPPSSSVSN